MRKKIIGILVVTLLIATTYSIAGRICERVIPEEKNFDIESDQSPGEEPTPSSLVIVYTDRIVNHIGDPIEITFKNNGQGTVSIGGPPMYYIERFSFLLFQWQHMYPDMWGLMFISIASGGRWVETWDQQTSSHVQVPWGLYRVIVPYYDFATNTQEYATDFFFIAK